jgi:hypothetical protein
VATEQRISTSKVFCPSVFTLDGHELTNLQYRVLSHFKSSDIIFRLPALKKLDVVIHPSLNAFTMGDFTIHCKYESRTLSCMIVDSDKTNLTIVKQARNKKNLSYVFLISLHFGEELAVVKSDLGEQLYQQLKHHTIEFADITEDPQGRPPHLGHLEHKVKLTCYPLNREGIECQYMSMES